MARKLTTTSVCAHCGLPIGGRRKAVWLSTGPAHADCNERHWQQVQDRIAQATKAGRHGPLEKVRHLCGGCRQWVRDIFHVDFDGKPLCWACTPPAEREKVEKVRKAASTARGPPGGTKGVL